MLSPSELIDRLSSTTTTPSSSKDLDAPLHAPLPLAGDPLLYMVIDLRSEGDIARQGGCAFPTAVTLDPEFLSKRDVLDAWLQHFDSVKGEFCLCIVDMPPVRPLTALSGGGCYKARETGWGTRHVLTRSMTSAAG